MWIEMTCVFAIIVMMTFIIIALREELRTLRGKLYTESGDCRECGYPRRMGVHHLQGNSPHHHPNCPIGRLGL